MNHPSPSFIPHFGFWERIENFFHKRKYGHLYPIAREELQRNLPFLTEVQIQKVLPSHTDKVRRELEKAAEEARAAQAERPMSIKQHA